MQAYEQLIPAGDQPSYFIYFTLDPATIDVNIHPTKTEIKFENEQPIWQILVAAVREALAKSSAIPSIDFNLVDTIDIPVHNPPANKAGTEAAPASYSAPAVEVNPGYDPFASSSGAKRPEFDWSKLYQGFEEDRGAVRIASKAFVEAPAEESSDEAALNPEALGAEALNVCYQYKGRYVVTSLKSGLAVIDQYRAHVRVLFDQYLASIRQRQGVSQQVLFPEIIEFTAAEATVLPALLESLRFAGFDLSDLGNDSYAINGLPAGMGNANPAQLVRDIVDRAMETGAEASGKVSEAIAFSLARAAAIRPGKPLSTEEMDHLIASLFACPDSNLTPDGKTIVTIITDEELERRFR